MNILYIVCAIQASITLFAECNGVLPYHLSRKVQHIGTGLVWLNTYEHIPIFLPSVISVVWYLCVYPFSCLTHDRKRSDYGILIYMFVLSIMHILIHLIDGDAKPWIIMFLSDPSGYIIGKFCPWNYLIINKPGQIKSVMGSGAVFITTWVCCSCYMLLGPLSSVMIGGIIMVLEIYGGPFDNFFISVVCMILSFRKYLPTSMVDMLVY